MAPLKHLLLTLATLTAVLADGTGIIGFGKTMYQPPCAFACRAVVAKCRLRCSPPPPPSPDAEPAKTPGSCYVADGPFMQTVALCLAVHCRDAPPRVIEERYWPSHLPGTGAAGSGLVPAMSYREALEIARADERRSAEAAGEHAGHAMARRSRGGGGGGWSSAVRILPRHGAGHGDEEDEAEAVNTTLPIVKSGTLLNTTSYVRPSDWLKQYNSLTNFEAGEVAHSKYTLIITIVPFVLVLLVSLPRLLPFLNRSPSWTHLKSLAVLPPVHGRRHRQSVPLSAGYVPTRGQALYVLPVLVLNLVALLVPHTPPPSPSPLPPADLRSFELNAVACRAGLLALGNAVVLVVLAGRNLLPLPTRLAGLGIWAHDARLLLHRVFGYLAVAHTLLHSVLMLVSYRESGKYAVEAVKPYWIWGAVGAVAAAAILPSSVLALRQRAYEAFLALHRLLAVLFFLAYFLHIFYRFQFKWGYEIWCYVAVGLWAAERLLRIARVAIAALRGGGYRARARVAVVPGSGGEYLRVDIDGLRARRGGHVYLYFPTLGWQFWENHPFSIAWSSSSPMPPHAPMTDTDYSSSSGDDDSEEKPSLRERDQPNDSVLAAAPETTKQAAATVSAQEPDPNSPQDRVSILVRVQSGMTARLAARVATSSTESNNDNNQQIRIPVLVEGPYHTAPASRQLAQCSSIVCIAGGVGIGAVLPVLLLSLCQPLSSSSSSTTTAERRRVRLCWGVRNRCLVDECEPDMLRRLRSAGARVDVSVGSRLDIPSILREEIFRTVNTTTATDKAVITGPVGVVVCGPPAMADEVRYETARLGRSGALSRGIVLVDEAFTW